jgi:hypothetical protein
MHDTFSQNATRLKKLTRENSRQFELPENVD